MKTDLSATIDLVTAALLSVNNVSFTASFERSGLGVARFTEDILVPVLDRFGERWQTGELSLSQIYMSGRMCEKLLEMHSSATSREVKEIGLAVAILEDFHVLGKRMLCSVLYAAGYGFTDYGPISLDDLVEKVQKDNIRILLVSTLMLSSALRVKLLKERLAEQGLNIRIVVGGAPFRFDSNLWCEVGADATSASATGIIAILQRLVMEVPNGNV